MDVLREVLLWSSSRPAWQRDALRRIVTKGKLDVRDFDELALICKAAHGLAQAPAPQPLQEAYLPERNTNNSIAVSLSRLVHHSGVNALAKEQTVQFGPNLTVVYGANAAGKSGYTRILKRICRARGAEAILGNVVEAEVPPRPAATIGYRVGARKEELHWSEDIATPSATARISVFDRHCAAVYLTERTDVAFRPFGLDVFDRLSSACTAVRDILTHDRRQLQMPNSLLPLLPETTVAGQYMRNLTSLSDLRRLHSLAFLTESDLDRISELEARIADMRVADPKRVARELNLRATRLDAFASQLQSFAVSIQEKALNDVWAARDDLSEAEKRVKEAHRLASEGGLFDGTGSTAWKELWRAAERFSSEPYTGKAFPVTDPDAQCVLCQQQLDNEARLRFQRFAELMRSSLEVDRDSAAARYRNLRQPFEGLAGSSARYAEGLADLMIEAEDLAAQIQLGLGATAREIGAFLQALDDAVPERPRVAHVDLQTQQVAQVVISLRERAADLAITNRSEKIGDLTTELEELSARRAVRDHVDAIEEEIERKKKLAALELCLRDASTNAVTRMSTEVTKIVITDRLAAAFQRELKALGFVHAEVDLEAAGGERGALYHRLVLRRAKSIPLLQVLSEGEARCLSIASFFAELSTAEDPSAILFDDPVSSLDHNWRQNVAKRLVQEARKRQVVAFTHDVVFMVALVEFAEEAGIDLQHQYLRREPEGPGVCSQDLPWVAMKVKSRLGVLRKEQQYAATLFRTQPRAIYERQAKYTYGLLREAWERAVEEVLLGSVVERYRRGVQTQQARKLADITEQDCDELEQGMSKASQLVHDQAAAEGVPVPEPAELLDDIQALDRWVDRIRRRR